MGFRLKQSVPYCWRAAWAMSSWSPNMARLSPISHQIVLPFGVAAWLFSMHGAAVDVGQLSWPQATLQAFAANLICLVITWLSWHVHPLWVLTMAEPIWLPFTCYSLLLGTGLHCAAVIPPILSVLQLVILVPLRRDWASVLTKVLHGFVCVLASKHSAFVSIFPVRTGVENPCCR